MLAFIDESGDPHPTDSCMTWALAAVCVPPASSRQLSAVIHGLKMRHFGAPAEYGDPMVELKAKKMFNRTQFRRAAAGNTKAVRCLSLVDAVFGMIQTFDEMAIYAVVGKRPTTTPIVAQGYLSAHRRFLLQRIQRHAWDTGEETLAVLVFDEKDPYADAKLSLAVSNFLFNSAEGKKMTNLLETPMLVSSIATPGVQLADLVASCLRNEMELREEGKLTGFTADHFVNAVGKYAAIVRGKTKNFPTEAGGRFWGIWHVPEFHLTGAGSVKVGIDNDGDDGTAAGA